MRPRRFSVDEYHLMAEAGIIKADDRVELLDGEVVEMGAIGIRHVRCVTRLTDLLEPVVESRAMVSIQSPLRLSDRSQPEPDVALLRWRDDSYPELPGPGDVLLVIEVADASVDDDRLHKLPLYAAAAIREVWLVDLVSGVIEVNREPGPLGYSLNRHIERHERLAPLALPGLEIEGALILG